MMTSSLLNKFLGRWAARTLVVAVLPGPALAVAPSSGGPVRVLVIGLLKSETGGRIIKMVGIWAQMFHLSGGWAGEPFSSD